jgi:16S rRNA processing protein RimM
MAGGAGKRDALVCLGQIGAPHGVRGEVRLRSFTAEPEAIAAYGALQTEDGRAIAIESLRPAKDHFVATLAGIHDRDAAAQLANAKLYVPRERLPQLADPEEFYHSDLIGLAVVDRTGRRLGSVVAIHNFGAGDLLEVRLDASNKTELLAFNDENVPSIDIAGGKVVIEPPAGWSSASSLSEENDEAEPRSQKRGG